MHIEFQCSPKHRFGSILAAIHGAGEMFVQ